jgi:hypothetical protein
VGTPLSVIRNFPFDSYFWPALILLVSQPTARV